MLTGIRKIFANPGILFITRFLFLFAFFYGVFMFFLGVDSPGGLLNVALPKYLNVTEGIRASLLAGSAFILQAMDHAAVVLQPHLLQVDQQVKLSINNGCIGFGIFSFWIAFVAANKEASLKKRWIIIVAGLVALWLVNITRIVVLSLALLHQWSGSLQVDHHTAFNVCSYLLIFLMIYGFTRSVAKPAGSAPIQTPSSSITHV